MSQCYFCHKNTKTLEICCPSGTTTCLNCLINGQVQESDTCNFCKLKFGQKLRKILMEVLHASNSGQGGRTQMESQQFYQNQQNLNTNTNRMRAPQRKNNQKKHNQEGYYETHGYDQYENSPCHQGYMTQNQNFSQGYPPGYYNQFSGGYNQNFSSPQNFQNNWVPQPNYFHYNQMYPPMMMPMHQQFPPVRYNYPMPEQNPLYHDLMRSATKPMNRINFDDSYNENEMLERSGGRYGRMQNKTTEYLQQTVHRDKSTTKLMRSNSLSNLSVRR